MEDTARRDLLKVGAAGMVAAGLALAPRPSSADDDSAQGRGVHIHGTLDPGGVQISITVNGRRSNLSGAGWDVDAEGADRAKGACYYSQEGAVHRGTVELSGIVLFSNTPDFLNARVTTEAHFSTGAITWMFQGLTDKEPFVFTGTGTVIRT